jgi:hypothetical protein
MQNDFKKMHVDALKEELRSLKELPRRSLIGKRNATY